MRKPIIIANWKMNTTLADAEVLATQINNAAGDIDVDIVLCPPSIYIYPIYEIISKGPRNIHLGAQNIWFTEFGSVTGEISAPMLKGLAKYVIIGHSERRSHFFESDHLINDKIHSAIKNNLKPIICVGELKKIDENKLRGRPNAYEAKNDVFRQLEKALTNINRNQAEDIIIAYEPVWAIGTGKAATGAYAAHIIEKLRDIISKKYNNSLAERMRILYGGSVTSENVQEFIYQPEIDGVLAGTSSLKASEFLHICKEASGGE